MEALGGEAVSYERGTPVRDTEAAPSHVCPEAGAPSRGGPMLFHLVPRRAYRGTSLIRNRHPVGPYSRTMPRLLWRSWGGGVLMSEVPLYLSHEAGLSGNISSRGRLARARAGGGA